MSQPDADEWTAAFIERELNADAIERWVQRVYARIVAEVPDLGDHVALRTALKAGCRAHWRAFLANLEQPTQTFHLVEEAKEVAALVAQSGLDVAVLFRVYSAGEQEMWTFITEAVAAEASDGSPTADVLVRFWSRSSVWFDRAVEDSVGIFNAERDRIRHGDVAERLDVVRAVLDGQEIDDQDLSARLGGHPMTGYQTAAVLHTQDNGRISDLPGAASRLGRVLGSRDVLVVHPGGRDLWCWVATPQEPGLDDLREVESWLAERGISAAVGTSHRGTPGLRLSHREALAAQHVARNRRGVVLSLYADVEVISLIGDTEDMRRFVERTLGGLCADDEGTRTLRRTLLTLLRVGSVEAAAEELVVHRNTVRYRVDRAQLLMGRELQADRTHVDLALRCHEAYIEVD